MAIEKQPTPHVTRTIKDRAAETKTATKKPAVKNTAVKKKENGKQRTSDYHRIVYDTLKVIVPLWFLQGSVRATLRQPVDLRPEAALCLMIHGANNEFGRYSSIADVRRTLLPYSSLGINDVDPVAFLATYSLFGLKLAQFVDKSEGESNEDNAHIILTKKGQKLYELAKQSVLEPSIFENQ